MPAMTTRSRETITSSTPPSTPRLRMEPTGAARTLLDGGWWPRSTDPVAEIPGLVLAIDQRHGPISRLILAADGWDTWPNRVGVAGRVLRLGYFASQPADLLTAICVDGARVDLLVVPPATPDRTAEAAMDMAATADNTVQAGDIVLLAGPPTREPISHTATDGWEAEGGHVTAARSRPAVDASPTSDRPAARRGGAR
jgi:hypothetical protein